MPEAPVPPRDAHAAGWSPLLEALPLGVMLANAQGHYLEANAAACRILGMDRETLLASSLPDPRSNLLAPDGSVLSPDDTPGAVTRRTGRPITRKTLGVVQANNDTLWLEVSAEPLLDGGVLVSFEDITQHHLTETILAARARLAEQAPAASLEAILRATLDEAEHLTGSGIGFFHFVEPDQQTLTLQAWSTRTEAEFCHAAGKGMHYAVNQAGVWADAIQARKPVIHNDCASLAPKRGLPEGHATVLRELVVPVLTGDRIVALLGVGNKPFPYGNRDLQAVQRLAELAWELAERKRSAVTLRESEARYHNQFETMVQGAFRQRADGVLIDINPSAVSLFGVSREDFLNRTSHSPAWDVIDEAGSPLSGDQHPSMVALSTGRNVSGMVVGIRHALTGNMVWVEANAIPEFREGVRAPHEVYVTLHDITEKKLAEQALLESEERWQTLVEQAGDGFELLDEAGRYLQVNEATCEALGYTREELLQLTICEIDPTQTLDSFQVRFKALIDQPSVTFETIHRRKNGSSFPAEATVSVIRHGEQHRLLAQVRDITARKQAEEELRTTKDLLNLVLNSLEAHVAILDGAGTILAVNEPWRAFARENGITNTVGTVEQVNYLDVLACPECDPGDGSGGIRQGILGVLQGTLPSFQADYPCDSPTEQRWFRMHVLPLRTGEQGAVVTHENITAEKLALLSLRLAHEQLSFAQRAAGAGMWEWDLKDNHLTWSKEMFHLYGLDPGRDHADLATFRRVLHRDDLVTVEQNMARMLAERLPFADEYRVVLPDGQVRWIEAHGSFDLDPQGQPIRAAGLCVDQTLQKQAEVALAASETKARTMLQTARDGVWLIDPQGQFRDANDAACVMLGYPKEDLLKLRVADIEVQEDPEEVLRHIALIARQGWDVFESQHRRKDGSAFPTEVSVTHQPDLDLLVVFVRDITERRRAKEALLEAEWKFRALFENGPIGVAYHRMVYDETGMPVDYAFLDANSKYIELTGVDPRGRKATEAFPGIERDPAGWIGIFGRVAQTGEPIRFEQHLQANDRWYDVVGYQYRPDHFVAAFLEITQSKQAELALQASEASLRNYIAKAPLGIFICDEQGRYVQVNPAACTITGYSENELLTMSIPELLPQESQSAGAVSFQHLTTTGETQLEIPFRHKDGHVGMWALEGVQLSPTRFMGLVTNITERLRLAEEARELHLQLQQAQKMEGLGNLAGGVAHDMNNMLGAIMGLASIHQEQAEEGSRLRKNMDTILKACTRGRTLVKGLLGFARQGLSEIGLVDLNAVIREEVALLERTIPANVQLQVDLVPELRPIQGDAAALSHVLMNLCVNALDAMPAGGRLSLRTLELDPDSACLEVEDTGTGMPPEVLEKAMDPFFTTKAQGKGTGLGLAIVYGTVKAHHGRVELASTPEVGTRVRMHFPASSVATVPQDASPRRHTRSQPLHILLVDDDELIQDSLSELLRSQGHLPTVAVSGEAALLLLSQGLQADAVVLDLNMPGLGGAGTLPLLRASHPDLPILLATGRADQVAMNLVASTTKTSLLPKPFSANEIADHFSKLGVL
jgi:PAS domain S-box-containing protein